MIFHKDLTNEGISRMCKKYFADQLQAGNYKFLNHKLLVRFDYHQEGEFYVLAELHGHDKQRPGSEAALVDFLITAFGGKI